MKSYVTTSGSPEVLWPTPIETIWNAIPQTISNNNKFKRPDIGLSHRLLIASILNLPADQRPWGIVTWLSDFYRTSRQTIYTIADSILHLTRAPQLDDQPSLLPDNQSLPNNGQSEPLAPDCQVERAILKMAFPGSVSIRPMQEILTETLGVSRSIGFISQLLTKSGQLAGKFLSQLDYAHLDGIIGLRDETFFNGQPILLLVEPKSGMIVSAHVTDDRKSDTWATILLMTEEQNLKIKGLVEDMAKAFPASLKLIEHSAKSKKDHWHIMRNGGKIARRLENRAYRWIARLDYIEKKVNKKWSDKLVKEYLILDNELKVLMDELSSFEFCLKAINEALEIVEVESGRICDLENHQWYLSEIVDEMKKLEIADIKSFYTSFRKAFDDEQLLTHLVWVAPLLASWREKADLHWGPTLAGEAEKVIARHWKLGQLLINGHKDWQEAYDESTEDLKLLCHQNPESEELARLLFSSLDASPRASSLIENINGQLKRFLNNRRSLRDEKTLQSYLNLFVLWYNSHLFKRGKRKGKSPFEWANMNLPKGDWLSWLGFPKAN
jgi:hypothetical protein